MENGFIVVVEENTKPEIGSLVTRLFEEHGGKIQIGELRNGLRKELKYDPIHALNPDTIKSLGKERIKTAFRGNIYEVKDWVVYLK